MRVVEGAKHCSLEGVLLGEAETDALSAAVGLIDREALGLLVGYICLKEARELVFKRDALGGAETNWCSRWRCADGRR
jgi:hypothetical protein